jgi:hypothetical protein
VDYVFEYQDKEWHGTRVNITGSSPPNSFGNLLNKQKRTSTFEHVQGWVNPADPNDSMLYREVDNLMGGYLIMGLGFTTFGGLGLVLTIFFWRTVRMLRN